MIRLAAFLFLSNAVVDGWLCPSNPATVPTSVPLVMNRLAAVWRRLWTFRSVGRSFAFRIFLKRHVKVGGVRKRRRKKRSARAAKISQRKFVQWLKR